MTPQEIKVWNSAVQTALSELDKLSYNLPLQERTGVSKSMDVLYQLKIKD